MTEPRQRGKSWRNRQLIDAALLEGKTVIVVSRNEDMPDGINACTVYPFRRALEAGQHMSKGK